MRGLKFRWSLRDLRSRWIQVLATAAILAVGAGAFAGLRSLEDWRLDSLEQSQETMRSADLRVDLEAGESVPRHKLSAAVEGLDDVEVAQERLVAESQLSTGAGTHGTIVPARLVGIPGSPTNSPVNAVSEVEPKSGGEVAGGESVLDWNFAEYHQLPSSGQVNLAGYGQLRYVATGISPQYLLILSDGGVAGAESSLAVLYVPLRVAQATSKQAGKVNQILVRGRPGTSESALAQQVRDRLDSAFPNSDFQVTSGSQEPAPQKIAQDAKNDQKTNTLYALLLVAGAALAAFMLVSRVVDSQRREMGIGMALGAPRGEIARRPITLGIQIGVLAAALGVPFGLFLASEIKGLMSAVLPLPADVSHFPVGLYLAASGIAMLTPVAAAALPVRRSLRMRPVDAIATTERGGGGGGWIGSRFARHIPGSWNFRLAERNLLRSPRRTMMSILGLAAVMTAVISVLAMVDSIGASADAQRSALLAQSPNRLEVSLTSTVPAGSDAVRRVSDMSGVAKSETRLSLGMEATANGHASQLLVSSYEPSSGVWHPATESGSLSTRGTLLSSRAADNLGVGVGDEITLNVPVINAGGKPTGAGQHRLRVAGIHSNPVTPFAYANQETMNSLGLSGIANEIDIVPDPGAAPTIQRTLFGAPGVASVTSVQTEAEALENAVNEFTGAIRIVVFMTLALGLLVAFTSASLTLDERRREFATLFAFGVTRGSSRTIALWENLTVGVFGTFAGVLLGLAVGWWTVNSLLKESFPELGLNLHLSGGSLALALSLGLGATAVAAILAFRRVGRMDVPSTLRFRE